MQCSNDMCSASLLARMSAVSVHCVQEIKQKLQSTVKCSAGAVQYSAVNCNAVEYTNAVKHYSAKQHSAVQYIVAVKHYHSAQ